MRPVTAESIRSRQTGHVGSSYTASGTRLAPSRRRASENESKVSMLTERTRTTWQVSGCISVMRLCVLDVVQAHLHRIESLPIVHFRELGGEGGCPEFKQDDRAIRRRVPDTRHKNLISKKADDNDSHRIIRSSEMPSLAGETKAKKSDGVIQAGTARTARINPWPSEAAVEADNEDSSSAASALGSAVVVRSR